MKVRTVTLFLNRELNPASLRWAGEVLAGAARRLQDHGYEVQTRRIALAHWDRGLGRLSQTERSQTLSMLRGACRDARIDFCGIGLARQPEQIQHLGDLLREDDLFNGGADGIGADGKLSHAGLQATGRVIQALAQGTPGDLGGFQFACGFNIRPGTPFFPVAYHDGSAGLAVAFENSDLVVKALADAGSFAEARTRLYRELFQAYAPVAELVSRYAAEAGLPFLGTDTSIAPSLDPEESLTRAYASLGVRFGGRGTLAVSALITEVLKSLDLVQCGYAGLMLAVMEDQGLSEAAARGDFGLDTLILCSSVCGVGVDTVPVPGNASLSELEKLLIDVGTLSLRLQKPLSVRVLPAPGKGPGEMTSFTSPYLCNTSVFRF